MSPVQRFQYISMPNPAHAIKQSILSLEIMHEPKAIKLTTSRQAEQIQAFSRYLTDKKPKTVDVIAIGSSKNAAMIGRSFVNNPALVVQEPSEYAPTSDVAIIVSQSGRSSYIEPILSKLRENGTTVAALTNAPKSILAQKSDFQIYTHATDEKAIAATGTMTSAIATFFHLGLNSAAMGADELNDLPKKAENFLTGIRQTNLGSIVSSLKETGLVTFLGDGLYRGVANEAALKLCETAGVSIVAGSTSEFNHGYGSAFASLDKPGKGIQQALFIMGADETDELARHFQSININNHPIFLVRYGENDGKPGTIWIPAKSPLEKVILTIIGFQIIAHDVAVAGMGIEPGKSTSQRKVN